MGFIISLFGGKAKLYGLIALAFVFGLLGWRRAGIKSALAKEQSKQLQGRLDAVQAKNQANYEAETQDDESLIDRISRKGD